MWQLGEDRPISELGQLVAEFALIKPHWSERRSLAASGSSLESRILLAEADFSFLPVAVDFSLKRRCELIVFSFLSLLNQAQVGEERASWLEATPIEKRYVFDTLRATLNCVWKS